MTSLREVSVPVMMALVALLVLGAAYPLATWAIGRAVAPWQSGGSLLTINGTIVGSELIAQESSFNSSAFFHPLPSSGADPYVPLNYALEQVPRISGYTGIPQQQLLRLVYGDASEDVPAIFGPGYRYVNVVRLNYELIKLYPEVYGRG